MQYLLGLVGSKKGSNSQVVPHSNDESAKQSAKQSKDSKQGRDLLKDGRSRDEEHYESKRRKTPRSPDSTLKGKATSSCSSSPNKTSTLNKMATISIDSPLETILQTAHYKTCTYTPEVDDEILECNKVDCVIIGCGVAGAAAAESLSDFGISFKILEGRDRVGGRTHTVDMELGGKFSHMTHPVPEYGRKWDPSSSANPSDSKEDTHIYPPISVDLGANYIHGASWGHPVWRRAEELNLPLGHVAGDHWEDVWSIAWYDSAKNESNEGKTNVNGEETKGNGQETNPDSNSDKDAESESSYKSESSSDVSVATPSSDNGSDDEAGPPLPPEMQQQRKAAKLAEREQRRKEKIAERKHRKENGPKRLTRRDYINLFRELFNQKDMEGIGNAASQSPRIDSSASTVATLSSFTQQPENLSKDSFKERNAETVSKEIRGKEVSLTRKIEMTAITNLKRPPLSTDKHFILKRSSPLKVAIAWTLFERYMRHFRGMKDSWVHSHSYDYPMYNQKTFKRVQEISKDDYGRTMEFYEMRLKKLEEVGFNSDIPFANLKTIPYSKLTTMYKDNGDYTLASKVATAIAYWEIAILSREALEWWFSGIDFGSKNKDRSKIGQYNDKSNIKLPTEVYILRDLLDSDPELKEVDGMFKLILQKSFGYVSTIYETDIQFPEMDHRLENPQVILHMIKRLGTIFNSTEGKSIMFKQLRCRQVATELKHKTVFLKTMELAEHKTMELAEHRKQSSLIQNGEKKDGKQASNVKKDENDEIDPDASDKSENSLQNAVENTDNHPYVRPARDWINDDEWAGDLLVTTGYSFLVQDMLKSISLNSGTPRSPNSLFNRNSSPTQNSSTAGVVTHYSFVELNKAAKEVVMLPINGKFHTTSPKKSKSEYFCRVKCLDTKTNKSVWYACNRVICTIPLGVLKKSQEEQKFCSLCSKEPEESLPFQRTSSTASLFFYPPLSARKQYAIDNLGFGVHDKVLLRFKHPFWPVDQTNFATSDPRFQFLNLHAYGKYGVILAHVWPADNASTTSTTTSKKEETMNEEFVQEIVSTLHRMFLKDHVLKKRSKGAVNDDYHDSLPEPIITIATRWGHDPFAYGSYSFMQNPNIEKASFNKIISPSDLMDIFTEPERYDFDTLFLKKEGESLKDGIINPSKDGNARLFFAGEHTSKMGAQCVVGAYISGKNMAKRVYQEEYDIAFR